MNRVCCSVMALITLAAISPLPASAHRKQRQMVRIGNEVVNSETGQLYLRAQEAISSGKLDEAENLLKAFLQTEPQSVAARYKYGFVLLQKSKYAEALEQAKQCAKQSPEFVGGWSLVGECSLELGLKEQAAKAYRKALVIQPEGENADIMRERLDELAGKLQSQPESVPVQDSKLAEENRKIMTVNEALAQCSKATEHFKQGQFEVGLQECREALKKAPDADRIRENYAVYLNNYAADCVRNQELKRAEALMKEAIAFQAGGGVSSQSKLTTLRNYSALLNFLNRPDEANQLQARMNGAPTR